MSHFAGDVEFKKLVSGRTDIDLVQLMLEFAADAYPGLDRLGCLVEIDRLGVACEAALPILGEPSPRAKLAIVSHMLYEVEGFHGNREAYYEPQNSYLNEVLARRCGIPISLGIVYMAVASRVGLEMFGVNAPGHFVVGCFGETESLFVDPFNGGDVLDRESCRRRIEDILNERDVVANEHFHPASPRDIAARVLRNLKAAYAMDNRWIEALPVQRRLAALVPEFPQERRDLGLIYLRVGDPQKALSLFEEYLDTCGTEQAVAMQGSLRAARKMVAELN